MDGSPLLLEWGLDTARGPRAASHLGKTAWSKMEPPRLPTTEGREGQEGPPPPREPCGPGAGADPPCPGSGPPRSPGPPPGLCVASCCHGPTGPTLDTTVSEGLGDGAVTRPSLRVGPLWGLCGACDRQCGAGGCVHAETPGTVSSAGQVPAWEAPHTGTGDHSLVRAGQL
uniref:Uncharacterized protein n=1 Tax=Rangifer tarandus platyrhynchus TaxID=3082113 RepID=A0ACB0E5U0_RANTA|nr:unnamed protein product [Rangifer tarandus platyrhynchus]